jgi:hypothetical protein
MADEPKTPTISQEQLDKLIAAIEKVERKRRIMLGGYLAALTLLVGGQVAAFWIFGTAPPGSFVGWVFFIPFAGVGAILWGFGRWSRSVR